MKKNMKNGKLMAVLSLCLAMLFGMSVHAAPNPASYYKIHLTSYWEVVATDVGGNITDWASDVYAGQTVDASVQLLEGKIKIPYTGIEWNWTYEGQLLCSSSSYVVPNHMKGKTLTVTAKLLGPRWDDNSLLTLNVPIN